jgi:hypothetical protein
MLRPWIKIKIGEETLSYVTTGEISSTWKKFTDTAVLTIPKKAIKDGKTIYISNANVFKKGQFATISIGYFPKMEVVFQGYLTKIIPAENVTLEFEDPSWILKQTNLTVSYKKITLEGLLKNCLELAISKASPDIKKALKMIKINAVEAEFFAFRLTNVNIVQVLDELKSTYALTSFFRNQTLNVGLAYNGGGKKHVFEFEENIISNDLEYRSEADVRIKVKVVSMLENNNKIEVEVGDSDGEQRTIFAYNVTSEKELKAIGEREKERLKYEGFFGTLTTFIFDLVRHGDEIELINKKQPEQNGIYYAEEVRPTFGVDGYFQTITLGVKISAK